MEDEEKCTLSKLLSMLCCPPLPSSIGNKMAFVKIPSTYSLGLKKNDGWQIELDCIGRLDFTAAELGKMTLMFIESLSGNRIACLYINVVENPEFTIVFSHGNAVDIGNSSIYMMELALELNVNVLCYDYSGYGLSSGVATEKNVCLDIDSACRLLMKKYNVPLNQIVVFGQSIGSVPTIDFASRNEVAGVIILSGLASGLKVLFPNMQRNFICDVFKNSSKITRVISPTLVIHGTDDEIVKFTHGTSLYESAANPVEPLWVLGAGHNNVEFYEEFMLRLKNFFAYDLRKQKVSLS